MVMKTGQYVLYEQKLKSLLNENAKLVINTKHREFSNWKDPSCSS
ncbi:uncharacterized protein CELE_ZK686.1 [Caenorhabditis elegans]|uniref:Uncharacterized protein ZK686.1 n=1 Tax=Caenorhabditis elegans TaxID=6239 RepID=YO11_CAEEL|nr:Uncharacterized protein CELE_ZK686.1 [Caenorhabditis elegans]P34667.2 RecName: Full=Uncharacterized protein ZK686.1 [Caenorhabditis elegans]CCD63646.1 Uncharacterized protein CELE_ZK686.1 [Caenorhabditis elegans]|eukprot:NP_498693.2 Uncharacterized protein CELE_ZK686.1 [Caenorhabditis elegans]